MADRVGVISKGELILVEEKATLMKKLGKRQLTLHLQEPLAAIPAELADWPLALQGRAATSSSTPSTPSERAHRHPLAAAAHGRPRHRLQGSRTPARARSRTSSSAWSATAHGGAA